MRNISFVMPVYNGEAYLKEAVDSIFNDNYREGDEVVMVDDGSTDGSYELMKQLSKKYEGVRLVKNRKNIGAPASRNLGIKQAKNGLIFNLDQDNVLPKGLVPRLTEELLKHQADVVAVHEIRFVNVDGVITHKWVFNPGWMTLADFLSGMVTPGASGNFLYTRQSWEKIGGYWEYGIGGNEAWGFSLKQLANEAKFYIAPFGYYFHRHGHESLYTMTSQEKGEVSRMATKMIAHFYDQLDAEDVEYIRENQDSWFDDIDKRPIRVKDGSIGTPGKVVREAQEQNRSIWRTIVKYKKQIFN